MAESSLENKMKDWTPDRWRRQEEEEQATPPKPKEEGGEEATAPKEGGETTPSPLEKKLSDLQQQVSQSSAATQVLNDPQVQELLKARQQGRKVKVVEEASEQSEFNPLKGLSEEQLEELSPKQIVDLVNKQLQEVTSKQVQPLREETENLKRFVNQQTQEQLKRQIAEVRERYNDFDDYRQEMLAIHTDNPSLPVEELYILAKMRAGKAVHPPKVVGEDKGRNKEEATENKETKAKGTTDTERPTPGVGKPSKSVVRDEPIPRGQRGFSKLLDEALEKHSHLVG